ncbi:SRPBCC family protein [Streptomyces yaizuensis]|uniref:SRPBCC family protein n=1 Tax=Streptomyces yaizuensis TaxID=2989713 RepID=A0ABQ5P3A6_9ACTN|nr:SRPBCC family protein [Streptomyces sp. YSPA8]GLF97083.1 SRPBCC family protein [Streptomyces sp. YSPA8]
MTVFRLTRAVPLPAAESWRRVTDWRAHADGMPLTSLASVTAGPVRPGTVLTVRSALGPFRVDDPMEVVRWEPPDGAAAGRCRLEKRGQAVTGWAEIEVRAAGAGSVVVWTEDLRIGPLPRLLDPLTARVGRRVFGRALDGLLRD